MDFQKITDKEEELMQVFWNTDIPLTCNDLIERSPDRSWKDSYLQIMLRSLQKKNMIDAVGRKLYRTQYANQYRSTMTCEEYYIRLAYAGGVNPKKFLTLIQEYLEDDM